MKIGILGLGSIGSRHATNLISQNIKVIGWDINEESRKNFNKLGGNLAISYEEFFERIDSIIISTPNANHYEDFKLAVKKGLHIFIEKPFAHTEKNIDKLLKIQDQNNKIVFAGLNLRFHPAVQFAKEKITDMGIPIWARFVASSYLPDWRPGKDYQSNYAADKKTGGVIFDFIHEFDLACHILGSAKVVSSISSSSNLIDIESDDCADIVLEHLNGQRSSIHVDYLTRPAFRNSDIVCEKGRINIDIKNRIIKIFDNKNKIIENKTYESSINDDYKKEILSFLECIKGKEKPLCNGWEALEVLKIVLAARKKSGLINE